MRVTLEPVPSLTRKEFDEIVPDGGYPGGRTQERKREVGDNRRFLYTRVKMKMPRSVHCGDNAALHSQLYVQRGEAAATVKRNVVHQFPIDIVKTPT